MSRSAVLNYLKILYKLNMSARTMSSHFLFLVYFNVTSQTIRRHVSDLSPLPNFISYDHETVSRKSVLRPHILMLHAKHTVKKVSYFITHKKNKISGPQKTNSANVSSNIKFQKKQLITKFGLVFISVLQCLGNVTNHNNIWSVILIIATGNLDL